MEESPNHRHRGSRLAAEEAAAEAGGPEIALPELALPELALPEMEMPRLPEVDLSGDSSFQNYLAQQTTLLLTGCCATARPKGSGAVPGCSVPDGADQAAEAARAACGAGVAFAGVAGGCAAPPDVDRGGDASSGRRGGSRSPVPRPSLPLPYRSSRSPVQGLPGEEEEAELRRAARRGRISPNIAPFGGMETAVQYAKPKDASTLFGAGVADGSRVDGCGL